ncbi:hypothetical protein X975_25977, partial [Stegodyphus mimosarum]
MQIFASNLRKCCQRLLRCFSPDLSRSDFFLFSKIKKSLKGQHLRTLGNIKVTTTTLLKDIFVTDFQDAYACFQEAWKSCCNKCAKAGGVHFEEY